MDEEEEIDIIGGDDDISKISSGQLLSCDYTVHPNWVDENAGENFWSDNVPKNENLESNVEVLQSEEVVIEKPRPVPKTIELEWAGEQAVFDGLVFENEIPATFEEIVINQNETSGDIYSNGSENQCADVSEIKGENLLYKFNEDFEPAAFETHPPSKNMKFIGPTNARSLLKVKIEAEQIVVEKLDECSRFPVTSNETRAEIVKLSKSGKNIYHTNSKRRKAEPKFKQSIKIRTNSKERESLKVFTKRKHDSKARHRRKIKEIEQNNFGENITISHETENVKPFEVLNEQTIAELVFESEGEIDVEADASEDILSLRSQIPNVATTLDSEQLNTERRVFVEKFDDLENNGSKSGVNAPLSPLPTNSSPPPQPLPLLPVPSEEVTKQLENHSVPSEELEIDSNEISELEKYIHSEYFEGRTTKTPARYLRVRNHIISMWKVSKPKYITKTFVRQGLSHGGDVNSISRIHRLLEQIGAINFGNQGKHFEYLRPLGDHLSLFESTRRIRHDSASINTLSIKSPKSERRQRSASSSNYQSAIEMGGDSNKMKGTWTRNISSDTILYGRPVKPEFELVKCLKFNQENPAPFTVSITLSTILCLQLHSLSSNHEVMGFLGGHVSDSSTDNMKVVLTKYKPCKTSQQSRIMCEMCPVSQIEQSDKLRAEGFQLLGWFHSHPLFPANPSQTDIQTQMEMQIQFSLNKHYPLVGLILSCLNMTIKCMYIMPKDINSTFNTNGLPYEVDLEIVKSCSSLKADVNEIISEIKQNCDNFENIWEKVKKETLNRFNFSEENIFNDIFL